MATGGQGDWGQGQPHDEELGRGDDLGEHGPYCTGSPRRTVGWGNRAMEPFIDPTAKQSAVKTFYHYQPSALNIW